MRAARRLLLHARARGAGPHLGAFGWVENVRPADGDAPARERRHVADGAAQASPVQTCFEDAQNGGYRPRAVAAAGRHRGGAAQRLSFACDSAEPPTFAVNLSSARMRAADRLDEGVRNGQPIAALLGYQLERGLHEGHPGVELDTIIYVLRDRFPLVSGRLTDVPVGTSVETVEARNVVHGLDLLEATAEGTYPYGITAVARGRHVGRDCQSRRKSIASAMGSMRLRTCCSAKAYIKPFGAISPAPRRRCRR